MQISGHHINRGATETNFSSNKCNKITVKFAI